MASSAHAQRAQPQADPLDTSLDDITPARRAAPPAGLLRGTVAPQPSPTGPNARAGNTASDNQNPPDPLDPASTRTPPQPVARTSAVVQGPVQSPALRGTVGAIVSQPVQDPRASTTSGPPPPPPVPPPQPPAPPVNPNPFAPNGITVGAFTLRPAFETGVGFTNNANGTATGSSRSGFTRNAAEAVIASNWSNHALGLRLRFEREDFFDPQVEARNNVDIQATGRIDVRRDTQIELGAGFRRVPDSAFTFNLPVTTAGRPDLDTTTFLAGVTQRFGRTTLRLRGQFDSLRYGDTNLVGGGRLSNVVRDLDVTTVTLRGTYDITPALSPFVEVAYNSRDYVRPIDSFGLRQGSDGLTPRAGLALNLGPALNGEIAGGFLFQRQREPTIPRIQGFTVDGMLAYQLSGLTTLRFNARSGVLDSQQVNGSTGGFTRDLFFTVEHALQRNLTLTGTLNLGFDQFAGITRSDKRLLGLLALTYRFNRNVSFTTRYVYSKVDSNVPGIAQSSQSIEGGLRIEY